MLTAMGLWGYRRPQLRVHDGGNITGADSEQRQADRSHARSVCRGAEGHRARRRTHRRMAATGPAAADSDLWATPPAVRAAHPGAVRRCTRTGDGCMATNRPTRRARPGADLRARGRVGTWQTNAAGLCAARRVGRRRLGLSVDRLPDLSPTSLATPPHRRQDRDRLGAGQRRPVRRRSGLRRDRWLLGRRSPRGLGGLTHDDDGRYEELHLRADTSVDAVVGIYGRYDWEDRSTQERELFMGFLENVVVRKRHEHHPGCTATPHPWHASDPTRPVFIVHGSNDSPDPRRSGPRVRRTVAGRLLICGGYLELPGTGHGFDMLDGSRTASTAKAIAMFLNQVHRDRLQNKTKKIM